MCNHANMVCVHLASNLSSEISQCIGTWVHFVQFSSGLWNNVSGTLIGLCFPTVLLQGDASKHICSINCSDKYTFLYRGLEGIGKALQIFKCKTYNNAILILCHTPTFQVEKLRQKFDSVFRAWIQQHNMCSQTLFPVIFFLKLP